MAETRFVILAAPRTGSNLLCTLLNSHPEILCHHELFNPRGIFYAVDRRDGSMDFGTIADRDRHPFRFLERVWNSTQGAVCVGFKMTRGQTVEVVEHLLTDADVFKIVLRRKNRLKTYVSQLLAQQTDRWEAYAEADLAGDQPKARVDVDLLKAHSAANEEFYETILGSLEAGRQRYMQVVYEQLFSRRVHLHLLEFLGVATQTRLTAVSVKQNPRDLRAVIANFEELESELRGSDYQTELYDVLT